MLREKVATGGLVVYETRRIWSHLLLLGLWERLPNLVPPLRTRAGPLQAIYGATMSFDSYLR